MCGLGVLDLCLLAARSVVEEDGRESSSSADKQVEGVQEQPEWN